MDVPEDIGRFSDAIMCLQHALMEGNKPSDIDVDLMVEKIHQCELIVKDLLEYEQDAFYKTALSSLQGSLSAHATMLTTKLQNLNNSQAAYFISQNSKEIIQSQTTEVAGLSPSKNTRGTVSKDCSFQLLDEIASGSLGQGENHNRNREAIIKSTILPGGNVKFSDVIGLKEPKQSLHDAIILPLMFPHLFSGGRRPWQRILLFGPPGTGKSRLAQAVATEVKATFYCVSSTDLMSSWVGESEKLIKELFHHANNQKGQAIIFIDEIDSLCRHRSSKEDEGTRRIKTELLIQMDGADQCGNLKILLLCATNCPWDLDTAFLRRFQKRIYVPLPDHQSRLEMLKLHSKDIAVNLTDEEWKTLATQTDGYSGSDLSTLTLGAMLQPVRDLQTASYWEIRPDGKWRPSENKSTSIKARMVEIPPDKICTREVCLHDFLTSLKSHLSTVSKYELRRFEEFTSCFGQIG